MGRELNSLVINCETMPHVFVLARKFQSLYLSVVSGHGDVVTAVLMLRVMLPPARKELRFHSNKKKKVDSFHIWALSRAPVAAGYLAGRRGMPLSKLRSANTGRPLTGVL